MKKWWHELPPSRRVAVISVVAFVVYAGGLLLIFRENIGGALFNALLYTLFLAGSIYFTQKRFRKTAARLQEHGQSLMFLRYPNSRPGSLSGVWQMGVATPSPGRIDFQPAVYDELIPSGRSRALMGLHVAGVLPRIAGRNDTRHGVPFGFRIMTMESDGGTIELAASPDTLQKIQKAVGTASQ
jgi:hypothetical protein